MAAGEGDLERAENLLAAADVLFDEVGARRLPLVAEVDGRTRTAVLAPRLPADAERSSSVAWLQSRLLRPARRSELRWVRRGRLKFLAVSEIEDWLRRNAALTLDQP